MLKSNRIGELLLREQKISAKQLDEVFAEQKRRGGQPKISTLLIEKGFIDEQTLLLFLSKQFGLPIIDLSRIEFDPSLTDLIPDNIARKYEILPIGKEGATLKMAIADPSNIFALDDLKFLTGSNIQLFLSTEKNLREALDKHYSLTSTLTQALEDLKELEVDFVHPEEDLDEVNLEIAAKEAPVVKLANLLLVDAIKRGASDIHFETYDRAFRVRYRIDGVLYEIMNPPVKLKNAMISRLKIMSNLNIAERRLPQDGRLKLRFGENREMDFRVSVLPTLFGEKVVLRLLDKTNLQVDLERLGFETEALTKFNEAVHKPYGMILVTGPTGSGKTTTLYSTLGELNKTTQNISTAEDPVELNIFGINQVQVHEEIGLSFANVLRSFLRQDPDIIMVGEIRDKDTAEISIKAALTGHLVLSTLHTNDASNTVTRLLDMGVEPFLVASSVNLVVAQRLVRKLCPNCKKKVETSTDLLKEFNLDPTVHTLSETVGCPSCNFSGYKGRIAIYEVLPFFEKLKELIFERASAAEIKKVARMEGMKTLRESGLTKVLEGVTTLEEVIRVTDKD
ncbi:MAG: type IV-A pilus assembly ATPase PilB [Deltaproteobacteria bacterium RBG_13_43_22]|nr:MAG: type IV-A pilus assembly ATPase PilB [Deltaproteobacteria bacterium RBG_13_43_22]